MEKELSDSYYDPFDESQLVEADKMKDSPVIESRFRSANSVGRQYPRLFRMLYLWLQKISGYKTYISVPPTHYIVPEPFSEIINSLDRLGFLSAFHISRRRDNDIPHFFRVQINGKLPPGITDGRTKTATVVHGTGVAKNFHEAISRALGEFLERYILMLYYNRNLYVASPDLLQKKGIAAMNLKDLAGFSEEQKKERPELRWDGSTLFRWEVMRRVKTGEKILAPAQLVYWNYALNKEAGEPLLREGNTNGCGGMFTEEEAILSALYELVQRDGFLLYWLNTVSPPRVDLKSVPDPKTQVLLSEAERYNFRAHCLDTTSECQIPSFAVILENLSNIGPKFCLGGGCNANPLRAIYRALEEAFHIYHFINKSPPFSLGENYQPFEDASITQLERGRLFANPEEKRHYQFLMDSPEKPFNSFALADFKEFASPREELSAAVEKVEKLGPGFEVYTYAARHPLLKRFGYHAARAVVPKLVPLYLRETNAMLGSERLEQFRERFSGELNTWPHPFP